MKGTQQTFGYVEFRKAKRGMCDKYIDEESGYCENNAEVLIIGGSTTQNQFCKIHAKETWLEEISNE